MKIRTHENELGQDAGARNIGRFFLWSIPLMLGLAATVWFGLWVSGYDFQEKKEAVKHEMDQRERSAVYVGAQVKPKGKLAIEIRAESCIVIVRADIDTKKKGYPYDSDAFWYSLILYGQNQCKLNTNYTQWDWEMVSPNGTVIKGGYENTAKCPAPMVGEIAECVINIEPDDRADKIRVWAKPQAW